MLMKISCFYIAEQLQLRQFKSSYTGQLLHENPSELFYQVDAESYMYVFDYGAVAFANMSDSEMSHHLSLLQAVGAHLLPEKLRDDFELIHNPGQPLTVHFESLAVPELNENVVRIVLLNLAYSVTMDFFADRAQTLLTDIRRLAQPMETEGVIHIGRRNMLRFIGGALNSKNRIVENLYIFDAPDLTWEDEYLDRIHRALARTFDLQTRFREVEYTFKVIDDNLSVFREFYLHRESSKLEWIIIILICIEVADMIIARLW